MRRCRRDLAQLKVLGFVQRQLSAAVAWHASIAVGIGIVVGLPLGIVTGRWLWILFAEQIGAVPAPTVPVLSVLVAAIVALVLGIAAAVFPGPPGRPYRHGGRAPRGIAGRTPPPAGRPWTGRCRSGDVGRRRRPTLQDVLVRRLYGLVQLGVREDVEVSVRTASRTRSATAAGRIPESTMPWITPRSSSAP